MAERLEWAAVRLEPREVGRVLLLEVQGVEKVVPHVVVVLEVLLEVERQALEVLCAPRWVVRLVRAHAAARQVVG